MKKVLGCIRKADNDFSLIEAGDKICVGVSGGKDSVLLLYCMSLYQRFCKDPFKLVGIHIDMGFGGMDFSEVDAFCMKHNISLVHVPSNIYDVLKLHLDHHGDISCSRCSQLKKGAVIEAAKQLGCNKIAFAHHSDDAVETLFMNMIFGGKVQTFKPKMYMSRMDVNFIRPLLYAYEEDIIAACHEANIPIVTSTCPVDKHTERENMKNMLHSLYERYPMAKHNFQGMLSNQEQLLLWTLDPKQRKDD